MILARHQLSHAVSAIKLRRAVEKSLAVLGTGTIQAITEDLGSTVSILIRKQPSILFRR